jgi:hypothetical protein
VQGRRYDELSAAAVLDFRDAHVGAAEPADAARAARSAVLALMHEGTDAKLPGAKVAAERLAEHR